MSDALLITGGTGLLGMELIARLLEHDEGPDVFVAARARDDHEAAERIQELLTKLYDRPPRSARRLQPVRAELTAPDLGLLPRDRRDIVANVGRVVHCAASISFTLPLDEARDINVAGTKRVLALARDMPHLQRLVHVSTAYVAGRATGAFGEGQPGGPAFRNTYEQTKHEAEVAVGLATAADGLPTVVVRPSIVVGESDSGWTSAFNVIYWPLQAFARGLFETLPADATGLVDMVPVNYVAEVIERSAFLPDVSGTVHAVSGDRAATVGEISEQVAALLGRRPPRLTRGGAFAAGDLGAVFAPYFDVKVKFDDRRARRLTGLDDGAPSPRDYLAALLDYGVHVRWGKRRLSREAARHRADAAAERAA
jgi:long-chain acyl-CoA synthetase